MQQFLCGKFYIPGDHKDLNFRYPKEPGVGEDIMYEPNIIRKIKFARLRWLGHLERMPARKAVKRAYMWRPIVDNDWLVVSNTDEGTKSRKTSAPFTLRIGRR